MRVDLINQAVEDFGVSKSRIAALCGISRSTLDHVLQGEDFKVSTLESLARVLGIGIGSLFDETDRSSGFDRERIEYLEKLLAEKERLIGVLLEKR